jgi:hypothetical protein
MNNYFYTARVNCIEMKKALLYWYILHLVLFEQLNSINWIHVCYILSGGRYMFAVYCQVEDDSVVYIDDHLINSDKFEWNSWIIWTRYISITMPFSSRYNLPSLYKNNCSYLSLQDLSILIWHSPPILHHQGVCTMSTETCLSRTLNKQEPCVI